MAKISITEFKKCRHYFSYDTKIHNLSEKVQAILETDRPLDQIHESINFAQLKFDNDQNSVLHRKYYDSPLYTDFVNAYKKFVREEILPLFEEKKFAVQKEPNFRVCLPNNTAIGKTTAKSSESNDLERIGIHSDGKYGHPEGEINFLVGLTAVKGSNGLFIETFPGSDCFEPLDMDYGQFAQFYGNKCRHYNQINRTGKTRISLDFRVIPMSLYDPNNEAVSVHSKRKFLIGDYYDLEEIV